MTAQNSQPQRAGSHRPTAEQQGASLEPSHQQEHRRHVVFVCTGNTCRSPFAEFAATRLQSEVSGPVPAGPTSVFQSTPAEAPGSPRTGVASGAEHVQEPAFTYGSAGTHVVADLGFDENMAAEFELLFPESPKDQTPGAPTASESDGQFHSRQLTGEIVEQTAVLIAMTREHRQWIVNEFPEAQNRTFLLKPLALMCQAGLVSAWDVDAARAIEKSTTGERFFTGTFRDDVTDPYRMGQTEAHRSAQEITDLLRAVLRSRA